MIFIDACFKKETPYTPVWMMRQAGRYLPEYRATRAKAGSFMDLCRNPELACEVTLQPIDILGIDAAILFSDILVIPAEMGMHLEFHEGKGPIFETPVRSLEAINALSDASADHLGYVYEAVRLIRKELSSNIALIGFAGSPWTLATYMVEGKTSKTFDTIKKMLYSQPEILHTLLRKLTHAITHYLNRQIEAGANAVQIFDSWGGALEEEAFFEFSWNYMKEIAAALKERHPTTPIILFSKGISGYLDKIDGQFDVFGVDWATPIAKAKSALHPRYALQGNMEPTRLYSQRAIEAGVKHILSVMNNEPGHIFNLGHGILPDVPVENAKYFIDLVHELSRR
ncbi:MAG: uroporphyrinogen decarboxylase [Campylobacterales bacterium]